MRVLAKGALCVALLAAGCSRNNIEAVNLANEGDQAKGSNLDEAISKYEQATKLDPTNHRILWKLALSYHKKEAWDKVATTCSAAEKQAPTFANYYFEHGHALMEQAKKGPRRPMSAGCFGTPWHSKSVLIARHHASCPQMIGAIRPS